MNLLLDTHILIWWLEKSPRIGARTRKKLLDPSALLWMSAASVWEISIKSALGRLDQLDAPEVWIPRLRDEWGVRPLPIKIDHAMAVRTLPRLHGDPFDRMLVAQALCEDLTLVTADRRIAAYDIRTLDASQ